MNHLTEEQIVLHYYGEAEGMDEVRQHLAQCPDCRSQFERLEELLRSIGTPEVPEPPASFEEKTWLNLRDRLPQRRSGLRQWLGSPPRWALAGTVALLLVAAFLAGRFWPWHGGPPPPATPVAANPQRVIMFAVGGHLERSQMLLVEIMNADAKTPLDLSAEQQQARDLLDANHLYRVSAQEAGDRRIAMLLDQLGRVLAEVANGPTEVSPGELQQIRDRIQSDNLLFKVRVVGSEVNSKLRRQEQNPSARPNQRL
jgi:hypothetical protein